MLVVILYLGNTFLTLTFDIQILLDQTDFLVVGVIGPQGAGKSTVLSVLGGAGPFTDSRFVVHYIGRLCVDCKLYLVFQMDNRLMHHNIVMHARCLDSRKEVQELLEAYSSSEKVFR